MPEATSPRHVPKRRCMSLDRNAASAPGGAGARPPMAVEFELRLLRRLSGLHAQFKDGHEPAKVPRAALRYGMELLAATEGCVAVLPSEGGPAQVVFAVPRDSHWDVAFLAAFLRGQKLPIPPNLALGRLRR